MPVIVENKPGASGTLGAQNLAREARPDGHTLSQMPKGVFRMVGNMDGGALPGCGAQSAEAADRADPFLGRDLGLGRHGAGGPGAAARPLDVAARGTPPATVNILHDAFKRAVHDPQHLAVLTRFDMPVRYLDSENDANDVVQVNAREIETVRKLGLRPGG